jgi:hypothetical protein
MQRFHGMLVFVLASTTALPAAAATFCATTPAQLQTALSTAAGNDQNDVIQIKTGTYDLSNVDLVYDPPEGNIDLEISGGWSPFFENPCGQQLTGDPFATILDGNGAGRILRISIDGGLADIDVRLLAFMNGHVDPGLGAGLSVSYGMDAAGTVTVERSAFMLNTADQSSALSIQNGSLQYVVNNLFLLNEGSSRAVAYLTTSQPLGISFTNNTVLSNSHTNTGQPTVSFAAGRVFIANNNFWDNDGYDFDAGASGDRSIYNNNYQSRQMHGGEILAQNIGVIPEYEDGFLNFTPVRGSGLVDAGREPSGASALWYLTDLDLNQATRVVGAHVDIGAYENETIFADGFELPGPLGF